MAAWTPDGSGDPLTRIHVGNGSVYLRDWTNVNIRGPKTFLAADRPDLVDRWITDESNYFGRHTDKTVDSLRNGPLDQEMVCDHYGDFEHLPGSYFTYTDLLARHVFEHLSSAEAHRALDHVDSMMVSGGVLRLDVPDHDATLKLYKETGDAFYVRHLLGPRNGDYGAHMMGYSRDGLKELVESHGFVFVAEEPNIHVYPAFTLRFVKPGPHTPYQYLNLPMIADHWKVLEIGPGAFPFPRADTYIDINPQNLKSPASAGKHTIVADMMSGLPEVENGAFDFCYMSHVMEHVPCVQSAINTLNRIAKRGLVVMPSAIKEGLFGGWEESDHKWLVLPSPVNGGPPVFVRHNREYMHRIKDAGVETATSHIWRTGPNRLEEARYLRKFFYQHEADYDLIAEWNEDKPLKAVIVE